MFTQRLQILAENCPPLATLATRVTLLWVQLTILYFWELRFFHADFIERLCVDCSGCFFLFFAETWRFGKFPNLKAYISENICTTDIIFSYNFPQESRLRFYSKIFSPKFFSAAELLAETGFGNQWLFTIILPKFPVWKAISQGLLVALVYFLGIFFLHGSKLSFSCKNCSEIVFPLKSY